MSLPRFFLSSCIISSQDDEVHQLLLDEDDRVHFRVLRLGPGEHIAVIDASGDYFECEIVAISDGNPLVRISRHEEPEGPSLRIVLVQGLAKADKMETVIRHATELGVQGFVPFKASRSIVKLDAKKQESKLERWQAIAKSAAMQSGQDFIASVYPVASLGDVCKLAERADALIICWEEADLTASLRQGLEPVHAALAERGSAEVLVVVGPEGGLTEDEVRMLLDSSSHASLVTLGPSILRTETAGIVAPALVLYELGCLGEH